MNADLKEFAKQYQPSQPKTRKPFEGEKAAHHGARYSPCGNFMIAGGDEGQVFRWCASGDLLQSLPPLTGHSAWVQAYTFAPKAKHFYTADSWGRLRAWDYSAWPVGEVQVEQLPEEPSDPKKKPAKKVEPKRELVVAKETGPAPQPLWDHAAAHDGWIRAIAVHPEGKQIATCGRDQFIRVWDATTGKKLHEFSAGEDIYVLQWHPQGKELVSGNLKGIIQQWDVTSGKSSRQFDASVLFTVNRLQDVGSVRTIAFDSAGTTLVAGGTKPVNGGNVQGTPLVLVFDWATGKKTNELTLGATSDVFVCDLQYDSRGFFIAGTSGNPGTGKLILFRAADKEAFFVQAIGNCHAVAMHPAGNTLAASVFVSKGGNGRQKNADGSREYPGGYTPISIFDLPSETQAS